jgi:signal transduction histidine kinase
MTTMRSLPGSGKGVALHRSLYGRIAIGYLLMIAVALAAQGIVILSMVDRSARSRPPEFTPVLADELGRRLAANPAVDLQAFAASVSPGEHVFVVMKDGRVAGARRPPVEIVQTAVAELNRSRDGVLPSTWESSVYRAVAVTSGGSTVGVLGIVPQTPWERYGLAIVVIGLALLAGGTLVSAVLIVGPVRRRIHDLQSAAFRLGAGDLTARAHDEGSDEVADLASAFNNMADELAKREAAVTMSNRARQQLLADVSHELMTPLTAVLGHLETLTMSEVRLDDQRRSKHVAVARREAQRIERLVGDLLDVARLEGGGGNLAAEPVPVATLLDNVMTHHEDECLSRQIRMSCHVSDRLFVRGDEFRLEQALQNVTANALRHTPDGGTVRLDAERVGNEVVIVVSDSGEGIAPEHLPLIFDRFYKASSARGMATTGSGLGLSIVKAIVMRHGGTVTASSVVGKGTSVRIQLPVTPVPAAALAAAHS